MPLADKAATAPHVENLHSAAQWRFSSLFVLACSGRMEINMAKKGMKRPEWTHVKPRNEVTPVPELQGKAKHTKEKAKPITER